jgi:hypothetical protein
MAPISVRTWFLLYDLAAGLVFLTAAGFGLILATGRTHGRRRWLLLTTTCCGAVLALLRGGIGVIQDLEQYDDAVPGAASALGGRHPCVQRQNTPARRRS